MNENDSYENVRLLGMVVVIIGFAAAVMWYAGHRTEDQIVECKAVGGEIVAAEGGLHCVVPPLRAK
jgi:hypothetical protein